MLTLGEALPVVSTDQVGPCSPCPFGRGGAAFLFGRWWKPREVERPVEVTQLVSGGTAGQLGVTVASQSPPYAGARRGDMMALLALCTKSSESFHAWARVPVKENGVRTSEGTTREFSAICDDEWELQAELEGRGTLEGPGTQVGSVGQGGCREGSPQWRS